MRRRVGKKRIDLSAGIARFGEILNIEAGSSRSGPVRFLPIRRSVSGSSQREGPYGLNPLVTGGRWLEWRGA